MKYCVDIEIDLPRDRVVELFDDEENVFKWMEGIESWDQLSGSQGETGAKSEITFKLKNREMVLLETITENNLPDNMKMTYEAKGVFNIANNRFEVIAEGRTRYTSEQDFQMKGLMRLVSFFMPNAFKKQTLKNLNDFKMFAEGEPK
ncbi:MAG: SRPBCC family protein [Crocinitomix sp.]|nr:SRPBCC family protein [Crocinitomix sp.]